MHQLTQDYNTAFRVHDQTISDQSSISGVCSPYVRQFFTRRIHYYYFCIELVSSCQLKTVGNFSEFLNFLLRRRCADPH